MAHPIVGMCDFHEGRNIVPVAQEERAYYDKMKSGALEIVAGRAVFNCPENRKKYEVIAAGGMDNIVENNVAGSFEVPKGIIGKVGMKRNCNAYECGEYSDINGGAIRTTPVAFYRISEQPIK